MRFYKSCSSSISSFSLVATYLISFSFGDVTCTPPPQFLYGFSLFQRIFFFAIGGGGRPPSPPLGYATEWSDFYICNLGAIWALYNHFIRNDFISVECECFQFDSMKHLGFSFCRVTLHGLYWIYRENSLELIELSSINKVSLV